MILSDQVEQPSPFLAGGTFPHRPAKSGAFVRGLGKGFGAQAPSRNWASDSLLPAR